MPFTYYEETNYHSNNKPIRNNLLFNIGQWQVCLEARAMGCELIGKCYLNQASPLPGLFERCAISFYALNGSEILIRIGPVSLNKIDNIYVEERGQKTTKGTALFSWRLKHFCVFVV